MPREPEKRQPFRRRKAAVHRWRGNYRHGRFYRPSMLNAEFSHLRQGGHASGTIPAMARPAMPTLLCRQTGRSPEQSPLSRDHSARRVSLYRCPMGIALPLTRRKISIDSGRSAVTRIVSPIPHRRFAEVSHDSIGRTDQVADRQSPTEGVGKVIVTVKEDRLIRSAALRSNSIVYVLGAKADGATQRRRTLTFANVLAGAIRFSRSIRNQTLPAARRQTSQAGGVNQHDGAVAIPGRLSNGNGLWRRWAYPDSEHTVQLNGPGSRQINTPAREHQVHIVPTGSYHCARSTSLVNFARAPNFHFTQETACHQNCAERSRPGLPARVLTRTRARPRCDGDMMS